MTNLTIKEKKIYPNLLGIMCKKNHPFVKSCCKRQKQKERTWNTSKNPSMSVYCLPKLPQKLIKD